MAPFTGSGMKDIFGVVISHFLSGVLAAVAPSVNRSCAVWKSDGVRQWLDKILREGGKVLGVFCCALATAVSFATPPLAAASGGELLAGRSLCWVVSPGVDGIGVDGRGVDGRGVDGRGVDERDMYGRGGLTTLGVIAGE